MLDTLILKGRRYTDGPRGLMVKAFSRGAEGTEFESTQGTLVKKFFNMNIVWKGHFKNINSLFIWNRPDHVGDVISRRCVCYL